MIVSPVKTCWCSEGFFSHSGCTLSTLSISVAGDGWEGINRQILKGFAFQVEMFEV